MSTPVPVALTGATRTTKAKMLFAAVLMMLSAFAIGAVRDAEPAGAACKKIAFIGIPGSNQGRQHNTAPYTANELYGAEVNNMRRALVNREGSANVMARAINYPASIWGGDKYWESLDAGWRETERVIRNIKNNCPNTRFVLAGYSQGAHVATVVTRHIDDGGTDPIPLSKLHRVALVGNPRYSWQERPPSVVAVTAEDRTIDDGGIAGDENWRNGIDHRTRDVCIAGDNICNFDVWDNGANPDQPEHHQYNWRNYPGTSTDITWYLGVWLSWGI